MNLDHTTVSSALFLLFVLVTLYVVFRASRQNTKATDFYNGGGNFSGFQNGLAIAGDYMSAASFLGIAGTIALFGYDGFLYSIGFLVAWLVALLLVAEPLRNSGRFTMGDVLAFRMQQRPVRTAAATSTVVVSVFYLLAQMVGAGALVSLLLGFTDGAAKNWVIVGVGVLMIIYVTVGGMRGTTYVQIIKAFLLMTGAAVMTIMVLVHFQFNISELLGAAQAASGNPSFLEPGQRFGKDVFDEAGNLDALKTLFSKLDLISLALALILGTAGLPHILIRFYTVPTSKDARKSVNWAIGHIGTFYLMTIALGFGAAALVGAEAITAKDKAGNVAAPMLAEYLGGGAGTVGGAVMLAVVGAIAFATILAVVAGLTLASSSSLAHDLYANVIKKGNATAEEEVKVARIAAFVIGGLSIVLAIAAQGLNVAFLVALAFAIAASGNLPAVLLSLFWKEFNTRGAVWAIYGGLFSAVGLLVFSPVVSGAATSLIPFDSGIAFNWFPLANPGIISIPFGFFMGWLGTKTSNERNYAKYAELEVRSLTGAGIAKAVQH
ncbi:cation acetate symporter [Aquiluna sp. KACHI24]|uniref:solute symporter family protein n=1 Tax=Aquiluna sp. KACHI24 TaxID=2968831 RepID=UPI0022035683|nr:cation acetate symporter [Aquiluna sp. KACHI24]BDQ00743.1 cation acetate symporter [Aquiluna sp. KACHI24]